MERFIRLGADAQIKVREIARASGIDSQDANAFTAWVNANELEIYKILDLQKLELLLEARKQKLLNAWNNGDDYSACFVSKRLDDYEEQLNNVRNLRKKLNL